MLQIQKWASRETIRFVALPVGVRRVDDFRIGTGNTCSGPMTLIRTNTQCCSLETGYEERRLRCMNIAAPAPKSPQSAEGSGTDDCLIKMDTPPALSLSTLSDM